MNISQRQDTIKMTTCSWLSSGIACTNPTSELVCSDCKPFKQKLYKQYKHEERKVSNALSTQEVRGDIYEVLKVINRLQKVIQLRKLFTDHLQPSAQDHGHKLRITTLYSLVTQYQAHLKELWNRPQETIEADVDNSVEEHTQSTCLVQVQEVVNQIVADPFADFEEDIKNYKVFQTDMFSVWNYMGQAIHFSDLDMRYAYNYMLQLNVHIVNCYSAIGLLIKGSEFVRVAPVDYRKSDLFPETIMRIYNMLYNDFESLAKGLDWIKYVVTEILAVKQYKMSSTIHKVDNRYKLLIHHYVDGLLEFALGVEWFGKNTYKFTTVRITSD